MSYSQPAISGWGRGFHTVRGGIDPGDHCFCPRVVEFLAVTKGYAPLVRRDLDVGLRDNSRSALAL